MDKSTRPLSPNECIVLAALYPQPSTPKPQTTTNTTATTTVTATTTPKTVVNNNLEIDDLSNRFELFSLVTQNGNVGRNLDPDLTSNHQENIFF